MKHNLTLAFTIIALIVSVYFHEHNPYFSYLVTGIGVFYFLTVVFGSGLIRLNYFVDSVNKGKTEGIAITFDDGPDPEITPQILDILAKENVKASFFVIGHQIEQHKELLQRIDKEGHTIGNHSFSHTKQLTRTSTTKLKHDIAKCTTAIENVIQRKPIFFRPPFGITNPRYKKAIKSLGLTSIGWSIRSLDTKTTDATALYNKVSKKITKGSILLLHDTQKVTVELLPEIIQYCKNNGINIVSLPELINQRAYICTDE